MSKSADIRKQLSDEPLRTPYGAHVEFLVGHDCRLSLEGDACLLAPAPKLIEIGLAPEQRLGPLSEFKRYRVAIKGFASAADAETSGTRLALAILWMAISKRFALRLDHPGVNACTVYDRTQVGKTGVTARGYATAFWKIDSGELVELMSPVLARTQPMDDRLLLSMELFAGARFQTTEQGRFIAIVSALEPLAAPEGLPTAICTFVDRMSEELRATVSGLADVDARLVNSLVGRVNQLKKESVRQSLARTVEQLCPGDLELQKLVDDAYALRSEILHAGRKEPYLHHITARIEDAIRVLYAARLGLRLATSVPIKDDAS